MQTIRYKIINCNIPCGLQNTDEDSVCNYLKEKESDKGYSIIYSTYWARYWVRCFTITL